MPMSSKINERIARLQKLIASPLSLQPDYGAQEARVAERWAASAPAPAAPSAERFFWHNPQKYEVRQFAETRAISNNESIASRAVKKDNLEISQSAEAMRVKKSPPTPTEIVEDSAGSESFSTLSRLLVQTDQPTPSVPSGKKPRPAHPDPEEHESVMRRLDPPGKSAFTSFLGELLRTLKESLPHDAVRMSGENISVTTPTRSETLAVIHQAMKTVKAKFPNTPVEAEVGHKPNGSSHTVLLMIRFA